MKNGVPVTIRLIRLTILVRLLTFAGTNTVCLGQTAVNAASGASAVAPGSLISIYGSFNVSTGRAASFPLPTIAGFCCYFVLYSGSGALNTADRMPLLYWSPSQINGFLSQTASLIAIRSIQNGSDSPAGSASLNIQTQAPGIFTNPVTDCSISAQGCTQRIARGIITDAYNGLVMSTNPARPGQGLVIWVTGLGTNPVAPQVTILPPTGNPANATVFYSGHQPSFVGLDQVNFYVPGATELNSPCIVGSHLELQLSMKSTVSPVVSNVISLPVLIDSCGM
jgi:uncharacterized protein (TIGR03437 family)